MKLAHLILCHTNPEQVLRLTTSLLHPDADIYVHVDRKVSIKPFLPLSALPNVYLVQDRVRVYWGGYSIVRATMSGFRQILGSGIRYDYVNLLSGKDYPLKPPAAVHKFLTDNPDRLFMNIFPAWDKSAEHENRLQQYYFAAISIRGKYTAERIARMVKPRVFPEGFLPIGRSQWYTIPMECVSYIVTFLESNPDIVSLFKYMWAPDELIFQSVLYNSTYRSAITNDNMRYVDWSEGLASPKVLTMADADKLTNCGSLFARKFDMHVDTDILDFLDKFIAAQ